MTCWFFKNISEDWRAGADLLASHVGQNHARKPAPPKDSGDGMAQPPDRRPYRGRGLQRQTLFWARRGRPSQPQGAHKYYEVEFPPSAPVMAAGVSGRDKTRG